MNFKLWGRRGAEICSFIISSSMILALFVYLGTQALHENDSSYLEIKASARTNAIKKVGDHYLIPIQIENLGEKTPMLATFKVIIDQDGLKEEKQFELDYLSKKSHQTIYLSHSSDPRGSKIVVQLESYQL